MNGLNWNVHDIKNDQVEESKCESTKNDKMNEGVGDILLHPMQQDDRKYNYKS